MSQLLLKSAQLFDANNEYVVSDVLIENERILQVGYGLTADSDTQQIDLNGFTLLPGLVNAHTHIRCAHDYTEEKFRAMAKAGVCLCHDLGFLVNEPLTEMIAASQATNRDPDFPELDFAGRYIAVKGGYGDEIPGGFQVGELVTSEAECRRAVDYLADCGVMCIKIGMDTGRGGSVETAITLPDTFVSAICQQANERGLRICAHVHELAYLERLVAGGITEASHVVKQRIPEPLMEEMRNKGIMLAATLTNFYRHPDRYSPQELADSAENVRRYHQAGGVVAVATDFMWPFERCLIPVEEMRLFRQAGFTTRETLICATLNGAKICRREADYGTIESGKYASLIAIPGQLDENFDKLEHPALVLNRGRLLLNDRR